MSGICGTLALDGSAPGETEIRRIASVLERRGPDGTHIWTDKQVSLGHTLLATTPEALVERLPLIHAETGCIITADVRIDNREELIAALELDDEGRIIGDGELVLLTYLKWGDACLDRLLGDFAFAIWDPRKPRLFCARDQVGMRQFIYHHVPGKLFAFATEPRALLQHPRIPKQINEGRIADFLEDLEAIDLTSTFFEGLHRLPPAHALTLDPKGTHIWRYWALEAQPKLQLPSNEAYATAFLEVFTKAVHSRLRSPGPIGSMLSGGMDSGSVSAVAAKLLKEANEPHLKTFSAIGTDKTCVETRTIRAAASIDHIDPNFVSIDDLKTNEAKLKKLMALSDEPFDGHMTLVRTVYQAAREQGLKVVLDGVGGDTTLGTENMIAWYLDQGRYYSAWQEAKAEERFWGPECRAQRAFLVQAAGKLVPSSLRKMRRTLLNLAQRLHEKRVSPLDPTFAARIEIEKRRLKHEDSISLADNGSDNARARRMLHPYIIVGRERYDRVASAIGIEPRDPFLDRRLLEFCLSLPPEQLQENGWPKIILRRAMAELLPDTVRWRPGKEHLGFSFTKRLLQSGSRCGGGKLDRAQRYLRLDPREVSALNHEDQSTIALLLNLRYLENWLEANV